MVSPSASVGKRVREVVKGAPCLLTKSLWCIQRIIGLRLRIIYCLKVTLNSSESNLLPVRRHCSKVLKNIFHLIQRVTFHCTRCRYRTSECSIWTPSQPIACRHNLESGLGRKEMVSKKVTVWSPESDLVPCIELVQP